MLVVFFSLLRLLKSKKLGYFICPQKLGIQFPSLEAMFGYVPASPESGFILLADAELVLYNVPFSDTWGDSKCHRRKEKEVKREFYCCKYDLIYPTPKSLQYLSTKMPKIC